MKNNKHLIKEKKTGNSKTALFIVLGVIVLAIVVLAVITGIRNNKKLYARSAVANNMLSYEATYADYLEEHGYAGTLSSARAEIDIKSFETSGELEAVMGETGLVTENDGRVSWKFNVPETGFYNLKLTYLALAGTTSDIQRAIYIDGEIPYSACNRIVISRWWEDYDIQTKKGNELRPDSYEVFSVKEWFVEDSDRRNNAPLLFYLTEGQHTLTFETVKEPLEFVALSFEAYEAPRTYAEVINSLKSQYDTYTGDALIMQAERKGDGVIAVNKSETSISVQKNHTDSLVVPYHAYYNRYNTIGGTSWEYPGDTVTWTVSVEKEGLYEISFKGRQNTNRGVTSYRRLWVNGVVPYSDVNAIGFDYSSEMNNYVVAGSNGEPLLFHLNAGENTISLEVVMGPFGSILAEIEESLKVLNTTYLHVIQLTGQAPSRFIDYEIDKKVPEFRTNMKAESERLVRIVDEIVAITGEKGENTALLQKMAIEAEGLAAKPESVIEELAQLKNNISAVGTWIVQVSAMPLELDSFALFGENGKLPGSKENPFIGAANGTLRFFASFFIDNNSVGESEGAGEPITVWVASYGKEQAQIIQNLVDNTFAPNNNIPVKIQLIPADVVLRAALAGNGPDVVIGLGQSTVQDFAMRNATLDLTQFSDYEEVTTVFPESTLMTAGYNGGVYGLPETANFLMMFYREDILKELNASVPKTWTEFIELLPVLQQNNYSAFIPNAYVNDGGGGFYLALVQQYGGVVYNGTGSSYGVSSGLSSNEAMEAFKDYTDFYTNYGLNVQVDFSNRFRTGEIPIGIANYTMFCTLEIFAPEIKGVWNFTPIPGTMDENGNINNNVLVGTSDTVIMRRAKNPENAWKFIKWWMSSQTQLDYCRTVEAVMGTAARVATANLEVMEQLPWSNSELKALQAQISHSTGIGAVPGYYMTDRMISYAFSNVITNNSNPRESLYLNVESINKELTRKRNELGLD